MLTPNDLLQQAIDALASSVNPEAKAFLRHESLQTLKHGFLGTHQVHSFCQLAKLQPEQACLQLLPLAACFSRPGISDFRVGAIALGASGSLYFGANLEFADQPLCYTIHAEQSAINQVWLAGETGLTALAVNASPCGHCRQFIAELDQAEQLNILQPGQDITHLPDLLPDRFGPMDLGMTAGLFGQQQQKQFQLEPDDEWASHAVHALQSSYAPYSNTPSALLIQLTTGQIIAGCYAENAAFNPSLTPVQSALSRIQMLGHEFSQIQRARLYQHVGPVSHFEQTRHLMASLCAVELELIDIHSPITGIID